MRVDNNKRMIIHELTNDFSLFKGNNQQVLLMNTRNTGITKEKQATFKVYSWLKWKVITKKGINKYIDKNALI